MSNLDMYFPKKGCCKFGDFELRKDYFFSYVYGMIVGFLFCLVLVGLLYRKIIRKNKKRKKLR
ncbi:MAG: hypothetical protein KKG59_04555 [Nanoarchaeota archaeon]|nr:hypothetical protein [Nanoarchaeota archaeon]